MKNIRGQVKAELYKLHFLLSNKKKDAIELGKELLNNGFEDLSDGFWVYDLSNEIEYYSPKFRKLLEFKNEEDFPNTPKSWLRQIDLEDFEIAKNNLEKHLEDRSYPYYQIVTYNTKKGNKVDLICSGAIVCEKPLLMIGTHEFIRLRNK